MADNSSSEKKWTLFHIVGARSSKVVWLLMELEIEEQVAVVEFEGLADVRSRPGFDLQNPLRKVPALKHERGTLLESGAIEQFILSVHNGGRLQPQPGTPEWPLYLQWVWFGEATLTAPTGIVKQHTIFLPEDERKPQVAELARAAVKAAVAVIELELEVHQQPYILGKSFSAADIGLTHGLRNAQGQGLLSDFPKTSKYLKLLQSRPKYQQAYTKPYPHPCS